jgi:glycosyltransferase involved in cell wall biosynthesis
LSLPQITLITPSYGQAAYLEQTIDSVLSQGYPNLEYMVVDGGSSDGSKEVIEKYAKYLSYWCCEPDKGQSHAINKGLERATGMVFNWLNADDYHTKDCLHTVGEAFASAPLDVFSGRSRVFMENGSEPDAFSPGLDWYAGNLAKTIGWARIDQPETFWSLPLVKQAGGIRESFHYIMDKDLWIRALLLRGESIRIKRSEAVLANFRIHPGSKTSRFQELFAKETKRLWADLGRRFPESAILGETDETAFDYIVSDPNLLQRALHYALLYQADLHYFNGAYQCARQFLQALQKELLQPEDYSLVAKLHWRLMLPDPLIRILRRTLVP